MPFRLRSLGSASRSSNFMSRIVDHCLDEWNTPPVSTLFRYTERCLDRQEEVILRCLDTQGGTRPRLLPEPARREETT